MKLKDVKRNFLITTAMELFLSQGIEKVTIKDIAVKAGVGEMTIYRYFGKKQNIVLEAMMQLQDIVFNEYFKLDISSSGYHQLEMFYATFLNVFNTHNEFYRFLREFDLYMLEEDNESLQQYEDELSRFKDGYLNAYQLGIQDGSVKPVDDIELFYFTTTHALLELCKKLSSFKTVLPQDEKIEKGAEIACLIKIILNKVINSSN